ASDGAPFTACQVLSGIRGGVVGAWIEHFIQVHPDGAGVAKNEWGEHGQKQQRTDEKPDGRRLVDVQDDVERQDGQKANDVPKENGVHEKALLPLVANATDGTMGVHLPHAVKDGALKAVGAA